MKLFYNIIQFFSNVEISFEYSLKQYNYEAFYIGCFVVDDDDDS